MRHDAILASERKTKANHGKSPKSLHRTHNLCSCHLYFVLAVTFVRQRDQPHGAMYLPYTAVSGSFDGQPSLCVSIARHNDIHHMFMKLAVDSLKCTQFIHFELSYCDRNRNNGCKKATPHSIPLHVISICILICSDSHMNMNHRQTFSIWFLFGNFDGFILIWLDTVGNKLNSK